MTFYNGARYDYALETLSDTELQLKVRATRNNRAIGYRYYMTH
ncbi:MAG TPA: hypothetical protein VF646_10865 [Cytophagales bacterium]